MNVEENRLRTFADWPANAAVDAARVARAGFYYIGRALEVQCFFCGTRISDWNYGDQAIARHRQAEPECPYVQNPFNTCNVPLLPTSINNTESASSSIMAIQSSNASRPARYKNYSERLRSFTNWPKSSIVSPELLAKVGFFYLQFSDVVECTFCKGVLKRWEPGDSPHEQHRIHFPTCEFYMHIEEETDELQLSNVKLMPGTTADLAELGIQAHTPPKMPQHATYEGRLRTFSSWPRNLKQSPEKLASAGFYYSGCGDNVRCFHCDGSLHNWQPTDEEWTEHARWFPKCGFVNLIRGKEFIKQCIANRPPLDPSIFEGVPEDENTDVTETPPASLSMVSPPAQEITEASLESLLHAPPAMAALEVGLHVGRIKRALKRRMEVVGYPHTNPNQLIEDVLREQVMETDEMYATIHRKIMEWDDSTLEQSDTKINTTLANESPFSELLTLLNRMINGQGNNTTRESNNAQDNNVCEEMTRDEKHEICTNVEEKSESSNQEGNADKQIGAKSEETASLEEENRRLRAARLCKICMDREVAIVFLPCGHLATCVHCAPSLTGCPMCRQEILATVRTFLC